MGLSYWEYLKTISAVEVLIFILGIGLTGFVGCTFLHWFADLNKFFIK